MELEEEGVSGGGVRPVGGWGGWKWKRTVAATAAALAAAVQDGERAGGQVDGAGRRPLSNWWEGAFCLIFFTESLLPFV